MHRGGEAEARGQRLRGLALALLAAALLGLSIFAPKLHSTTVELHHNRLVDGWEGIALISSTFLVLVGAVLGMRRRGWGWLTCAAGAAALGVVIYASTGSRLIGQFGGIGGEAPTRGVVGIGLLVAGLGALLAIGAGLLIALAPRPRPALVSGGAAARPGAAR